MQQLTPTQIKHIKYDTNAMQHCICCKHQCKMCSSVPVNCVKNRYLHRS